MIVAQQFYQHLIVGQRTLHLCDRDAQGASRAAQPAHLPGERSLKLFNLRRSLLQFSFSSLARFCRKVFGYFHQ
jgi:hypothetical protein